MICVLPGDGIGPIVTAEACRVLDALGLRERSVLPFGYDCWRETGEAVPEATLAAVREAGVALVGAATTPEVGCASPILALRRALELDLLVRPAAGLTVVGLAFGGSYAEPERPGAVLVRELTPAAVDRLVAEGFARATHTVTAVDKPTVFRESAALLRAAAARHQRPGIAFELVNADAFAAGLVADRHRYDIVCAESFVADILSDLAAALDGGVGTAPSAALGRTHAVFEPVHGSAPRRAGEWPTRVDPTGAVRAVAMLLAHIGEQARAACVTRAVDRVGPIAGRTTREMGDALLAALERDA